MVATLLIALAVIFVIVAIILALCDASLRLWVPPNVQGKMNTALIVVRWCAIVIFVLSAAFGFLAGGGRLFYPYPVPFILHSFFGFVLSVVGLCAAFGLATVGLRVQKRKVVFLLLSSLLLILVVAPFGMEFIPKDMILDGPGISFGDEELTFEVVENQSGYVPRTKHVVYIGWLKDAASLPPREAFRRLGKERSSKNREHSPEDSLCVAGMLGGRFRRSSAGTCGGTFTRLDKFDILDRKRDGNHHFFNVRFTRYHSHNFDVGPGKTYFKLLLNGLPAEVDTVVIHFHQQPDACLTHSTPLPHPPLSDITINIDSVR